MSMGLSPDFIGLLTRMVVAGMLGAVIGFERGLRGRDAGVRTNMLVCVGAALLMIISEMVARLGSSSLGVEAFTSDPGRIAAQIITGIGFIGAGVIIKEGFTVHGLTTAAVLWFGRYRDGIWCRGYTKLP